jgi:hypothetical protein
METYLEGRPGLFVDEFFFTPEISGKGSKARGSLRRPGSPKRLRAALAAGLAVVLLAGFFVLRMGGGAQGQVFAYALARGDKHTYDLTLTMNAVPAGVPNAQPFEGKVNATLAYEVVDEAADGSSTVAMTLQNMSMEPNMGTAMPNGTTLRVTIAPDGRVTNVEGAGGVFGAAGASLGALPGSPQDTAGSQFMFPQFPSDAVAPGDSWDEESTFPLPFGDNAVTVNVNGKHNGFENSQFGNVAKFHHSTTMPLNISFAFAELAQSMGDAAASIPPGAENAVMRITGDMSMDADSLVIPDTGELVSLDGDVKMTMHMKMEGLPEGAGAPGDFAFTSTMDVAMLRTS